jgi:hypothetical protein
MYTLCSVPTVFVTFSFEKRREREKISCWRENLLDWELFAKMFFFFHDMIKFTKFISRSTMENLYPYWFYWAWSPFHALAHAHTHTYTHEPAKLWVKMKSLVSSFFTVCRQNQQSTSKNSIKSCLLCLVCKFIYITWSRYFRPRQGGKSFSEYIGQQDTKYCVFVPSLFFSCSKVEGCYLHYYQRVTKTI